MTIQAWLRRRFQYEEMDGNGRCATYLRRWTLLKLWSGIGLYLHHFVGDDWSLDLHDHPKRFISIGLKGSYAEITPDYSFPKALIHGAKQTRIHRAPWIRTFPAEHIHRIALVNGQPCWTLVLVLHTSRPWGFWHLGKWVPWRQYVNSDTATQMKSCP